MEQDLDFTREELLRRGVAMLVVFTVIYAVILIEIVMSFRPNPNGVILLLFTFVVHDLNVAGYYMVMFLDVVGIIGALLGFYGIRWVCRAKHMKHA